MYIMECFEYFYVKSSILEIFYFLREMFILVNNIVNLSGTK